MDVNTVESNNIGVLTVLVTQFRRSRLPRLLEIKESVIHGNKISEEDIEFLNNVISDANHAIPTVNGVPEPHSFCSHVTHLIQTITERALINEEKNFLPDLSNDQRTHSPIITPNKAARAVTLTPGYS
ncbi:hypothetical protein BOV92_03765 [Solemya velum gill symbiont]|nr:hypothetical protein BOV92_03765 [Solemya velum gill symbiont]